MKFWKIAMSSAGVALAALVLSAPAKADAYDDMVKEAQYGAEFVKGCAPKNIVTREGIKERGCRYQNRAGDTLVRWSNGYLETVSEAPAPAVKPASRIVYRDQYGRPTESPVDICTKAIRAGAPVTPFCQNAMAREILFEATHR